MEAVGSQAVGLQEAVGVACEVVLMVGSQSDDEDGGGVGYSVMVDREGEEGQMAVRRAAASEQVAGACRLGVMVGVVEA